MTIKTFAALAVLLGSSAAVSAQSFEAILADGSVEISRQAREIRRTAPPKTNDFLVQGAPKSYARTITCAHPPKESGLPDGLRFYTGLDDHPPRTAPKDDTAAGLNDYRRAYLQGGKFHYDAWSCDTQDYWFAFDAESLLKTTPRDADKPVKGRVRIETRGQVDWEGDLDCVANW